LLNLHIMWTNRTGKRRSV